MWTRSTAFDAAVVAGGVVVQTVQVLRSGVVQSTPVPLQFLPGSSVHVDRTAPIRRTLKATFADPTGVLNPKTKSDVLAPYGNQLAVNVGFQYPGGTVETVPVGVFALEQVDATTEGLISVSGRDRGSVIEQALFDAPYVVPASQNLATAIQALLTNRYPGTLDFSKFPGVAVTTPVTPTVYQEGTSSGNPWQNAVDLAFAAGYELFFDAAGFPVLQPIPNPSPTAGATVVWTYSPGTSALVIDEQDSFVSKDVYNEIVVIGNGSAVGTTGEVRATAVVTDPNSPILPGGAFGKRPYVLRDSTITSQVQAQATANSLLLFYAGSGEAIQFSAAPHPAHDGSDVVRLTSSQLSLDVYLVLQSFELDLGLQKPASYQTFGARQS